MLSATQLILEKLTGKSSLNEVDVNELQQLTEKYPYFAAAQFLLAKKLNDENNEAYKTAIQKTALHFDNALWLNINLGDEDVDEKQNEAYIINKPEIKENVNDDINEDEDSDETDEPVEFLQSDEPINEKLSNLLKEQAAEFEKPVEATKQLPEENTPYHRIDYFDSQGIKLDPEKEAEDKLGLRLRRFTDWLKQMKNVNPNLANIESDVVGEIQAQNMAARSNESKETVTEAMADVLVKQGKPEQAIQLYEKLSFSNPSKSAYFAAKILELKAK